MKEDFTDWLINREESINLGDDNEWSVQEKNGIIVE